MASQIILKNGQDQEFSITHPDNVGAININSNELVSKDYLTTTIQPKLTGTATFTATDNKIVMTGIVTALRLEVGDVIQISGATDSKNNSEFTVEVITDANNIIVNQAHANKGTTKNIVTRASDTDVTIKLLAKHYNAPIGLGQDWQDVTASRALGVTYTNNTGKPIMVYVSIINTSTGSSILSFIVNGVMLSFSLSYASTYSQSGCIIIPDGATYSCPIYSCTLRIWQELR